MAWSEVCIFHFKSAWFGSSLRLSFGMSLTALVEDSAPYRTISCQYNHAEFLLHCTMDWILPYLHSLLPPAFVWPKSAALKFVVDFSLFFSFVLFLAQRKGANEISSTTECPNSAGLPQTETGKHRHTWTQHDNLKPGYSCQNKASSFTEPTNLSPPLILDLAVMNLCYLCLLCISC